MRKKWKFAEYDKETAKLLAEECDADPFVALLCSARGCNTPEAFEEFLSLEPMFQAPDYFTDMSLAAEVIEEAISNGDKIVIFGDYDCDGVTATALLYKCLKELGGNVDFYIPDRLEEGYGLSEDAVQRFNREGYNLIVTVDNGVSAADAVVLANELGMTVVVTDHHLPPAVLPDAAAVVDPHRDDCMSEFKDISGVGVAFRLACLLHRAEPEELIYKYGDLVAIGTVADVMPLVSENRTAVDIGCKVIKTSKNPGISALLRAAGCAGKPTTSNVISFALAPRINAAGRLGNASRAVRLLLTNDYSEANYIADEINIENSRRQSIEQEIFEQACAIVEENDYQYDRVIVVASYGWHKGIVGISAARMCEKYARPVILLSIDGEYAQGSGRSLAGFNLFEAISQTSLNLMVKFGGHELAAGMTLYEDSVDELRRRLNDYAYGMPMPFAELRLDCKLRPNAFNFDLADALCVMEPFGAANPAPVFAVCGLTIEKIITLSQGKHLKIQFSKDLSVLVALMFNTNIDNLGFVQGDVVDIAVTMSTGTYNSNRQLTLTIKDMRISGEDDELQFNTLAAYNDLKAGVNADFSPISLTREQVGAVYRTVGELPVCTDKIVNRLSKVFGAGRVLAALDVLEELELVEQCYRGNIACYRKTCVTGKTELTNSGIFNKLFLKG